MGIWRGVLVSWCPTACPELVEGSRAFRDVGKKRVVTGHGFSRADQPSFRKSRAGFQPARTLRELRWVGLFHPGDFHHCKGKRNGCKMNLELMEFHLIS